MSKKFPLLRIFPCMLLLGHTAAQASFPTLSRNDYFPVHSTLDPHAYLYTRTKEQLHERTDETPKLNHFSLAISPFGQNADMGKDIFNNDSQLGNLNARWSMLALTMGNIPSNQSWGTNLTAARSALFGVGPTQVFNASCVIDPQQQFGFFEFPATYRKRGLRFDMEVGIAGGFGIEICGGGADINFMLTNSFTDLTPGSTAPSCDTASSNPAPYPNVTKDNVETYLMCKLNAIAQEIGLELHDMHKAAAEDTTLGLFWRHGFKLPADKDHGWEQFLVIPHLFVAYIAPTGQEKKTAHAFDLPFGNNGHKAVGVKGGIDLDFTETIELGWELGFVHFWDHRFNDYFVPTSALQQGIFPFKTDVSITPGFNWHFGLHIQAHHFLEKLSFYGQWVIMEHKNDKIKICNGDSAYVPEALECKTGWKAQVFNTALNYDISPHIGLGMLWQAPLSQRNAFRSTTLMFGLNFVF
jgi:hypothetical protein